MGRSAVVTAYVDPKTMPTVQVLPSAGMLVLHLPPAYRATLLRIMHQQDDGLQIVKTPFTRFIDDLLDTLEDHLA